jgi:hypothetical protein
LKKYGAEGGLFSNNLFLRFLLRIFDYLRKPHSAHALPSPSQAWSTSWFNFPRYEGNSKLCTLPDTTIRILDSNDSRFHAPPVLNVEALLAQAH